MYNPTALLILLLSRGLDAQKHYADVFSHSCGSAIGKWPNENFRPSSNHDSFDSYPLFRLDTYEADLTFIEPHSTHQVRLLASTLEHSIDKFMIWTISTDTQCPDSRLQSVEDTSEHLSYSCPSILAKKDGEESLATEIVFVFEAGECGCHKIGVKIMDESNNIYTAEEDPYETLVIESCIEIGEGEGVVMTSVVVSPKEEAEAVEAIEAVEVLATQSPKAIKRAQRKDCCSHGNQVADLGGDCTALPVDFWNEGQGFLINEVVCTQHFEDCCKEFQALNAPSHQ